MVFTKCEVLYDDSMTKNKVIRKEAKILNNSVNDQRKAKPNRIILLLVYKIIIYYVYFFFYLYSINTYIIFNSFIYI